MRNRFSINLALATLLSASLACNMPTLNNRNPTDRMIVIDSLAVTPRESDGKNDLDVTFNYTPGTIDTFITCSIVTSSGIEQKVWSSIFGKVAEVIKYKADFSIRVNTPGNYKLHCWDSNGPASETTTFSILTSKTSGAMFPQPGDFSSATLQMAFDQASVNLKGYSLPAFCLPGVKYNYAGSISSLIVTPDGILAGECSMTYDNGSIFSGKLTGKLSGETGDVSFKLESTIIYTQPDSKTTIGTINATFQCDMCKFTSEKIANGTADYTAVCTGSDKLNCYNNSPETINFNGKIPATITFAP